jgi:putative transposase
MPQSFVRIWIHAIWSTRLREHLIAPDIEQEVYDIMEEEFKSIGCRVRIINGMPGHVHCLFLINSGLSISDTIKQVKGSSSHHINQNDITMDKFSWQGGYAAYSVSDHDVEKVYQYIKNQKQHHKARNFEEEYDELIKMHKLSEEIGGS